MISIHLWGQVPDSEEEESPLCTVQLYPCIPHNENFVQSARRELVALARALGATDNIRIWWERTSTLTNDTGEILNAEKEEPTNE